MRFEEPTKWETFMNGFHYTLIAMKSYSVNDEWGYYDFWKTINLGFYDMYIHPYDDPYDLTTSPERKLRLGQ